MVVRLAADPKMKAGVSMHPAHSTIMATHLGENEEEILNEIQVHNIKWHESHNTD